ncbi:MAG TPA: hypothetical protein VGI10_12755 [Polyangiaceae bacterium]|jgi:hypothetical protein
MRPLVPLAVAALLSTAKAHAAEPTASLAVTRAAGAEGCPDAALLTRAVSARLHRAVFRVTPADLQISVRIERAATGWLAVVDLADASGAPLGRRTLTTAAEHCSALDDSLALVIALLVATPPTAAESVPAAEIAPPASAKPAPTAPAALPRVTLSLPRDTYAPREPWRSSASVAGVAALGPLPGGAFGGELALAVTPPRLPELRVFANTFEHRAQAASPVSGARFSLSSVGLEACATAFDRGSFAWFICGGQSVGRVSAVAYGFDRNSEQNQVAYALLMHSGVRLGLGSGIGIRTAARAQLPLSRGVFVYGSRDGTDRGLFRMSPLDAVFELGLEISR